MSPGPSVNPPTSDSVLAVWGLFKKGHGDESIAKMTGLTLPTVRQVLRGPVPAQYAKRKARR